MNRFNFGLFAIEMSTCSEKKDALAESKPGVKDSGSSPSSSSIAETVGINEKSLLRKLDYKLLPPLTILYLLSFLDRSNGSSPLDPIERHFELT